MTNNNKNTDHTEINAKSDIEQVEKAYIFQESNFSKKMLFLAKCCLHCGQRPPNDQRTQAQPQEPKQKTTYKPMTKHQTIEKNRWYVLDPPPPHRPIFYLCKSNHQVTSDGSKKNNKNKDNAALPGHEQIQHHESQEQIATVGSQ